MSLELVTAAPITEPGRVFLTAQWRYLAMLSYEADRAALHSLVPPGTELDCWMGKPLLTMVGFLFLDTKVLGVPVPFHRDFAEVNLRFYVRRKASDGWRRGVVFVEETVPRAAIAWTARLLYGENYHWAPMAHRIDFERGDPNLPTRASYSWKHGNHLNRMEIRVDGDPQLVREGTMQEFVTEHYWGYSRGRRDRTATLEYKVEHPRWRCWPGASAVLDGDTFAQYGEALGASLAAEPVSAVMAEGSEVKVYRPVRI
ncbi:MAG TPA: DUF2071 domain-containing protein [Thermoanaerobaculia bacterium]